MAESFEPEANRRGYAGGRWGGRPQIAGRASTARGRVAGVRAGGGRRGGGGGGAGAQLAQPGQERRVDARREVGAVLAHHQRGDGRLDEVNFDTGLLGVGAAAAAAAAPAL